jgi:hypothetical protein
LYPAVPRAEFTELHCRMPSWLRRAVLLLNDAWFSLDLPATAACTNFAVFEKNAAAQQRF